MKFLLFIENRFVGEFNSPYDRIWSYAYYCQRCGEVYAKRIAERHPQFWHFLSGYCKRCAFIESQYTVLPQEFLLPGELSQGFAPFEILAEEFLYQLESTYGRNRTSLANPTNL